MIDLEALYKLMGYKLIQGRLGSQGSKANFHQNAYKIVRIT